MTRTTFRSILVAMLLVAAMASIGTVQQASAQQDPNCCTITFDVLIPPTCLSAFPLTFTSDWCPYGTHNYTIPNNGIFTLSVPGVCPFSSYLLSLTMTGGPTVPFGGSGTVVFSGGCTGTYTVGTDASGCLLITIR